MAKPKKQRRPPAGTELLDQLLDKPLTGQGGRFATPNAKMQLIEQDDEKRAFMAKSIINNLMFYQKGMQEPVSNDDELCDRINWFFMTCAETQQLPSVEKMANAIGIHRNTLLRWGTGEAKGFSPMTKEIVTQAKQILASLDAELATEGKTQPVVYMFRAKNFYEMRDQQEMVLTPNTNGMERVDPATIEAKYAELPDD